MRFHRALGGVGAITGYVIPLLDWAVDMFCQELDVKPFVLPTSMQAPHLRVFGELHNFDIINYEFHSHSAF